MSNACISIWESERRYGMLPGNIWGRNTEKIRNKEKSEVLSTTEKKLPLKQNKTKQRKDSMLKFYPWLLTTQFLIQHWWTTKSQGQLSAPVVCLNKSQPRLSSGSGDFSWILLLMSWCGNNDQTLNIFNTTKRNNTLKHMKILNEYWISVKENENN